MDRFEEMMQKRMKMSPGEQKRADEKNRGSCICGKCPSYHDCMKEKNELLYCTTGRSSCVVTMMGCLCPACPVTAPSGLKHFYFCTKGSEQEQRGL